MNKLLLRVFVVSAILCSCNERVNTSQQTDVIISPDDSAHLDKQSLTGRWAEPIPGNEKEIQGFELLSDSSAKSINSATLIYTKWWAASDSLHLVSKSIGNHTEGIDTMAYKIISLTKDSLILKDGEVVLRYKRS
ncbi:lipocalin family protein [Pinibacter soli]|uniref:Lipocalin family protein n=1 Tax=Pinibacter soli TaxID=3044211 RepID=A0ABT6R7E5_9BACT|nr:lipocalin family protein [Pinibacter soli]MDI3318491.1 lipocalin family protein [Pinibacter soli]